MTKKDLKNVETSEISYKRLLCRCAESSTGSLAENYYKNIWLVHSIVDWHTPASKNSWNKFILDTITSASTIVLYCTVQLYTDICNALELIAAILENQGTRNNLKSIKNEIEQ